MFQFIAGMFQFIAGLIKSLRFVFVFGGIPFLFSDPNDGKYWTAWVILGVLLIALGSCLVATSDDLSTVE
jgi:hypothetical protein